MNGFPPPEKSSAWTPDASFVRIARELAELRAREKRGGAIEERTKLILSLLSGEPGKPCPAERYRAQGAPLSLWPDADGLRLDLGPADAKGIHSHVPYSFLSPELVNEIEERSLADSHAARDIAIRAATARGDRAEVARLSRLQEQALLAAFPEQRDSAADALANAPGEVSAAVVESGARIPLESVRALLSRGGKLEKENLMAVVRVASELNGGYRGADGDEFAQAEHADAWKRIHASGAPSRATKSVYENRLARLNSDPANAEAAKLIGAILDMHGYAGLRTLGIDAVRGKFGDGEFLAFFSGEQYERVLLNPEKHVRGEEARANFESIPTMERSDFEAYEALLLPYVEFRALEKELSRVLQDGGAADGLAERIDGALSLVLAETDPALYEPFMLAGRRLSRALREETGAEAAARSFLEELAKMRERYGERFATSSAHELLDAYLKTPERKNLAFDDSFVNAISDPRKREEAKRFLTTLPVKNPEVMVVQSGTDAGIPFALESRALRALKITSRPTLLLETGAAFENADESVTARIADAIIAAGKELKLNIFMQGTLSGKIAETIVRKYWEYRANLPEGEEPFRLLSGGEPGKSVYAGELGYPEEELANPHPLLPIDTVLTPYRAGWSPGGDFHSYYPHVVWRQSLIRRAANGNPAATLVINGGSWSVAESLESLRDGFPQIAIPESGRFAAMLGHLAATYERWKPDGVLGARRELESFIASQPEETRARLQDDYLLMEERGLPDLLPLISEPRALRVASVDGLLPALKNALAPKEIAG